MLLGKTVHKLCRPLLLFADLIRTLRSWGVKLKLLTKGVNWGKSLRVQGNVYVRNDNRIVLGDHVELGRDIELAAFRSACIAIGSHTFIGGHSIIHAYNHIEIGENCLISPHCFIKDTNHTFDDINIIIRLQELRPEKVIIEDNVWLGTKVSVLPGVTIGQGSVIGSGAVVTKDIPPYSIAVGVPAKVIKKRDVT